MSSDQIFRYILLEHFRPFVNTEQIQEILTEDFKKQYINNAADTPITIYRSADPKQHASCSLGDPPNMGSHGWI